MNTLSFALSASRSVNHAVRLLGTTDIDTAPAVQPLLDLAMDNITSDATRINSNSGDGRLTYLMERLTHHLHDFARETRLSTEEWMSAMQFLVECGKTSNDEFILHSDILGLSILVDAINHPKPPSCTEGSVLRPLASHDASTVPTGASPSSNRYGEPLLVVCSVKDTRGRPVQDVKIDIWQPDSLGHHNVQHPNQEGLSERRVIRSDGAGRFWLKTVKPASYPIPKDGPVGRLLYLLKRQPWRPANLQFMFEKKGMDRLNTALYIRGGPYESSDPVFGVKESLLVDLTKVDQVTAEEYGVQEGTLFLKHDFVLSTRREANDLRDRNATIALANLGIRMRLVDHLPVPEPDLPIPDLD